VRINELNPKPTVAEPLEIPEALLGSVKRHQVHLASLVASLRAAGVHEDMVDASVRTLVDSYAEELTVTIRGLMKAEHRG